MKQIWLKNKNLYAYVDDEDFERVNQYTWHGRWSKTAKTFYAYSNFKKENGKKYTQAMHRFILGVIDPTILVDHENHNTLFNLKINLRKATQTENQQNSIPRKGTSKYKGVCRTKNGKKWRSQIRDNGKKLHLGEFYSEVTAAIAYDIAAIQLHGEFSLINFPQKSFLPLDL